MTRNLVIIALLAAAALLIGCSGGVLATSAADSVSARSENLDHNTARIGLDTWTISTAGPINVGSMAGGQIESMGESPETRVITAIGEAQLTYANDQDSVAEGIRVTLASGDVIEIERWASTGSTVVAEQVARYQSYVERALSLDGAALEAQLAYIELVEGPAVRGLVESLRALGSQGLSILPGLLGEAPSDPDPPGPSPPPGDGGDLVGPFE